MKEVALLTLITERDEFIIEAYLDGDKAEEARVDMIVKTGDPNYYIQYVQLK